MAKFKKGDKVQIDYPNKAIQTEVLTIVKSEKFEDGKYWVVEERKLAIPEKILKLAV